MTAGRSGATEQTASRRGFVLLAEKRCRIKNWVEGNPGR